MRCIAQTNNQFITRSFSNCRKRDKKIRVIKLRNNSNINQAKTNRGVLESSSIAD